MTKRKPALSDERLADIWTVRGLDYAEGELDDFDKLISPAVSRCLAEDEDNRAELAELLSLVLGERVSVMMLDAYEFSRLWRKAASERASEAFRSNDRQTHRMSEALMAHLSH